MTAMARVVESYRLTPLQESILATSVAQPHAGFGCPQIIGQFQAEIDVDLLEAAWSYAVDRHPVLRSVCRVRDGHAVHDVRAMVDVRIERLTVPDMAAPSWLEDFLAADRARGFDLTTEPPFRVTWIGGATGGVLVWTIHHVAMDADTVALVLGDVFERYDEFHGGQPDIAGRPVRPESFSVHAGYTARAYSADSDADAFWTAYLDGAVASAPIEFPALKPHCAGLTGSVSAVWQVDAEFQRRLTIAAQHHGVSMQTMVHGAWALVLERAGASRDVLLATALSTWDRNRLRTMAGPAINILPLRIRVSDTADIGDWLGAVQRDARARRPHLHTPTEEAVTHLEPSTDRVPFATLVNWQPDPWRDQLRRVGHGSAAASWELRDHSVFPLVLDVYAGEDLEIRLVGHADRYHVTGLRRALTWLETAMVGLMGGGSLGAVSILDPARRAEVLAVGYAPRADVPSVPVHRLIGRTDAPAVGCGGIELSYQQLHAASDRVAWYLRHRGVGPGSVVGLCLSRSLSVPVAVLGVLKAGGAYLPLDPEYPESRLSFMVQDSGARLVLTEQAVAHRLAGLGGGLVVIDGADRSDIDGTTPAKLPEVTSADLAYVIYTSGSTGRPKGVAVEHGSLTNLAVTQGSEFGISASDRVLQFASFSFDASVSEMVTTLRGGGYLLIAREQERLGQALYDRLRESRITVVTLPPSAVAPLPWVPGALPDLRTLITAGEPAPGNVLGPWARDRRVINAYGPTEVTVCTTMADLRPEAMPLIGRPLANLHVYILDRRLEPVPVGVPGELYVGGHGVARGYVGRAALTAERFVADRFGGDGGRLYRTGDLARWTVGGDLEFLGRVDDQIKIRGFRIELGEIEEALRAHPGVAQAAVVVGWAGVDSRIICYLSSIGAHLPSDTALRSWLAKRLPAHLVPDVFVTVESFPTTSAGKIDKAALPEPEAVRPRLATSYVPPRTAIERQLADIWADVLRVDRVGAHDSFLDLGGNSLRAVRVVAQIHHRLGMHVDVGQLLAGATIAMVSARLRPSVDTHAPIPRRRRGAGIGRSADSWN